MKRYLNYFLAAFFMIFLSACDGNDNSSDPDNNIPTNGTPTNGTMTATVDGNAWSAVQIATVKHNNGTVVVSGSDAAALALAFAFVGQTPGTYSIGPTLPANGNVHNLATTWTASSQQGIGTIVVSTLSASSTSGTFSFTAPLASGNGTPATRVVTNGTFNVSF